MGTYCLPAAVVERFFLYNMLEIIAELRWLQCLRIARNLPEGGKLLSVEKDRNWLK
jgi:hypothetical protein